MIAAAQLEKGATPDLELVRQVLEGSTSSFELIMRRYNRRLYRIARGVLRNDDDAEEVVQDAYVRAYRNLHQYHGPGPLSAWLARITMNEALGRLRSSGMAGSFVQIDQPEEGEEADSRHPGSDGSGASRFLSAENSPCIRNGAWATMGGTVTWREPGGGQ